ncbi:PREDICTED: putative B3 domain-containing protein At5g66980 [Ipomoea nil]|uniref:putative B3 domain-containing protein At5g66980 n=1 Tax=Ipomoea nil TaxID=35883 RepID=UPI0009010408|nr:PREDICTED: putative B3 domain-containing protein At5g66980 [Ipomoea nil]
MACAQKRIFSFFKIFCQQNCSQKLEIPKSYMDPERRYSRKVVLRNRTQKVWNIEITETRDACFFKHGWAKFVEDNSFINGDQLVFIYDHPAVFDFFVIDQFGCEKIIMEGEEARVKGLKNNNGGGVNCQDNTFLVDYEVNMVTQVKKDEDEMDAKEENNDVGFQYHTRSKGKSCIIECGFKRAGSVKKSDASPKKKNVGAGKNDARAKKKDVSEEENDASAEKVGVSDEKKDATLKKKKKDVPDHFGLDIFSSGRFTQPKNPYFVTKIRPKRRDDLYIPMEVIKDHNIELPAKVIMCDEKDKKWKAYIKTWGDGRTWLSGGWRQLCRWNLVQENDRCICEFVPSLGPELVLQVTVIRRKDLEAQPN